MTNRVITAGLASSNIGCAIVVAQLRYAGQPADRGSVLCVIWLVVSCYALLYRALDDFMDRSVRLAPFLRYAVLLLTLLTMGYGYFILFWRSTGRGMDGKASGSTRDPRPVGRISFFESFIFWGTWALIVMLVLVIYLGFAPPSGQETGANRWLRISPFLMMGSCILVFTQVVRALFCLRRIGDERWVWLIILLAQGLVGIALFRKRVLGRHGGVPAGSLRDA